MIKKILDSLFSTKASGLYILIFAITIGFATFIENDFGTSAAQKVIFKSFWFELLLVLFGLSIVMNIYRFRMFQQRKWAILLFHFSIIIILAGAGITRYFGSEGRIHIREGEDSNTLISNETYLRFRVKTSNGKRYTFSEPVHFASLGKNKFSKSYQIGPQLFDFNLVQFIPNPKNEITTDSNGKPILKIVISGGDGREEYFLHETESKLIHNTLFNFNKEGIEGAINILYQGNDLSFIAPDSISQFQMAINKTDWLPSGLLHPLLVRTLYSTSAIKFVIADFKPNAKLTLKSDSRKMNSGSMASLIFDIKVNGRNEKMEISGSQGLEGEFKGIQIGESEVEMAYGSKEIQLPFRLRLNDFILERYPGTNSPASYASEVTLIDPTENIHRDQRIYMNHVLDHKGYRFFQSSFDQDELGTVLSVNHDAPGTFVSYLGYFLLTIGMVWTLLSYNSRFQEISRKLISLRSQVPVKAKLTVVIFTVILNSSAFANSNPPSINAVDNAHASKFAKLQVQDQNGRIKPMNSLSNEILRKISKKENLFNLNADQIILGMMTFPEIWANMKVIHTGRNPELKKLLNINDNMLSYNDFFKPQYILEDAVMKAYNREPRDRGTLEKDIIKLDEKINICNLVYSGRLMQWFPVPNDNNNSWVSPNDPHSDQINNVSREYTDKFYVPYINSIREAVGNKNWKQADLRLADILKLQQQYGQNILMSNTKINLEILLNKLNVFRRLTSIYGMIGLLILILFFVSVFTHKLNLTLTFKVVNLFLGLAFIFHLLGLGLRWYVSGRAPWSNGYESMIYIAFTTMLSGLIFSRKSLGGLAAASILASTILMVAGLSWMDPEITPLVPVLKSYWLTIHVSMEAGSYGFLTLGALIGVLNLILMIFKNVKNGERINQTIKELTLTSEMILIAGIFIISIGTYLGGIWANESWGRYWGWDAKETWALVTILVYSFILHMRFIPGLQSAYAFNVASLFGFASVMMTYFGVNYYLSGLHSYAAGDPVPIPNFVYYIVFSLVIISLLAFWKNSILYKKIKF